jgi:hypothetical protein
VSKSQDFVLGLTNSREKMERGREGERRTDKEEEQGGMRGEGREERRGGETEEIIHHLFAKDSANLFFCIVQLSRCHLQHELVNRRQIQGVGTKAALQI